MRPALHPNIDRLMKTRKHDREVGFFAIVLAAVCLDPLAVRALVAQEPSNGSQQAPSNSPSPPKPRTGQQTNPFPEDTNSVPVLPSNDSPGAKTAEPYQPDYGTVPLPGSDGDPVRSPDDPAPATDASGASSSSAGLDNLLKPPPDDEQRNKHGRLEAPASEHPESAKEDESVGAYYLDQKNWKAARSRFESALVLDPENPDVYWGLAEAERHLGDYPSAKGNYLKVAEYDPDSKRGKEAKKILKEPEIESAKAVSSNSATPQQH
jgi:tetratricopeptide (TPR) repeat protein